MTTLVPNRSGQQPDPDHRPGVVKAILLAAGSFATAVGTFLGVAGVWGTPPELVQFAITIVGIITVLALGIAAVYLWRR